jgi:hypothetical protein
MIGRGNCRIWPTRSYDAGGVPGRQRDPTGGRRGLRRRAGRRRATADLARQAQASATLHAAVLRSELAKHRSLPFVLAQDPDVAETLRSADPRGVDALNRKLETLSGGTRAAVIYVLNAKGMTIAASNWREPTSFVGSDYSFRPYFKDATATGVAELFALGTVSRRPGLFMSRRSTPPGRAGRRGREGRVRGAGGRMVRRRAGLRGRRQGRGPGHLHPGLALLDPAPPAAGCRAETAARRTPLRRRAVRGAERLRPNRWSSAGPDERRGAGSGRDPLHGRQRRSRRGGLDDLHLHAGRGRAADRRDRRRARSPCWPD